MTPSTMKAAILASTGQPLVVDDVRLPDDLDVGQVLVKIDYSGICGAQLDEIDGVKGPDKFLPHLLGHEGSGVVVNTGLGVKTVRKGDRVVLHWRKSGGIQAETAKYQWQGRLLNSGWVTTFSEYSIVSENRLTTVPADLEPDIIPFFGCAVTTGLGVISNDARLRMGESIVVFGIGGVGLNVVQGAAMVSACPIIAVDLFPSKLEQAKRFGATHVVDASRTDPRDEIKKIVGAAGVDVAVDCTGQVDVIQTAYDLTSSSGRVILVGVAKKNISFYPLSLHLGKSLIGSHGGGSDPVTDIPRYVRLYKEGKLRLRELISARYPLREINTAIDDMRHGRISGRCVIQMHQER